MGARYAIRVGPTVVEAWSVVGLPFEPKGAARDFRDALRAALRGSLAGTGHLHAIYGAAESGRLVDAENILFYNVGTACLRYLMAAGVSFERTFERPPPPVDSGLPSAGLHHHRNEFGGSPVLQYWSRGDQLASFVDVPVSSLAKPGPVWAAVRGHAEPPLRESGHVGPFIVDVSIGDAHREQQPSVADLVKPVLDGVISAYHSHEGDGVHVAERLANLGLGDASHLQRALGNAAWNVLQSRVLVWPFGAAGVQWNPADDLCVAAHVWPVSVPLDRAGPRWRLAGAIHAALPSGAVPHSEFGPN